MCSMNCNNHNITVNLSLLFIFVQVSQRPQAYKITSAVFKCLSISSVQGNSVNSLLFIFFFFFYYIKYTFINISTNSVSLLPPLSYSFSRVGFLLMLILAQSHWAALPNSELTLDNNAANNWTPCFWPLAVFHLAECLSKGFVPVPGLLERSRMSKSFPVVLPFAPAWGEHSLNVLEVISKQSIKVFFEENTEQKQIQNTWRLLRMPWIAVEPLFWLKAEVMAPKNSLQPLHAWGGGEAGLVKRRRRD